MFFMDYKAGTKAEWLGTHITALVLFGNGESDMDKAHMLANYLAYHFDGQDGYDLGGEG